MVIFVTDLDFTFWTFSAKKMMSRFVTKTVIYFSQKNVTFHN